MVGYVGSGVRLPEGKCFVFTLLALSSVNWDYNGTKFIAFLGLLKEVMM